MLELIDVSPVIKSYLPEHLLKYLNVIKGTELAASSLRKLRTIIDVKMFIRIKLLNIKNKRI